jgi:hypothetical protein
MKAIARYRLQAEGLLDRIARHRPGRRFEVYALPNRKTGEIEGFQVAEIQRVGRWDRSPLGVPLAALEARQDAGKPITRSEVVLATVTLPLASEGRTDIGVMIGDKIRYFGRTTMVNLTIGGGLASITMPRKQFIKRGFEALLGKAQC